MGTKSAEQFEKLGAFYLGRLLADDGEPSERPLLYDARDLTTHAVCIGMTGSGKTGLLIDLVEEAAIDGIPVIAVDLKGDLLNLALTFPELSPGDFRPWLDPAEMARRGMTVADGARAEADRWREGIASWGQDGARIRRLREAVELGVHTPGRGDLRPLDVLKGLGGRADDEAADRTAAVVSGVLRLVGRDPDPIGSRDHILLSTILNQSRGQGRPLDLAGLVSRVQAPGFDRVGVLDLETFFPASDRTKLALALNGLLASPSFASWMQGPPLSIPQLLHRPDGRPRLSVLALSHLSEEERSFFLTVLLWEIRDWMRAQGGTGSLRAALVIDECQGLLPPTANPPTKPPLLTLLKQARAFGLGVVLATQNPVDLDYKALSNAGTWFLGRLQTERDVDRVLDGLMSAGSGLDPSTIRPLLAGMPKRVFLMHDVHEDGPVRFRTRWALSYLRGPITTEEIPRLLAPAADRPEAAAGSASDDVPDDARFERAAAPSGIPELFLGPRSGTAPVVMRPRLLLRARVHYARSRPPVEHWEEVRLVLPFPPVLDEAEPLDREPEDRAPEGVRWEPLPPAAARAKSWAGWARKLKTDLYRTQRLTIHRCEELGETSQAGEDEAAFRARLAHRAREERDLQIAKLKKDYDRRWRTLDRRLKSAEERVRREEGQAGQRSVQTAISTGAAVLSALFGRKSRTGTIGRAATALKSASRVAAERDDVRAARDKVEDLEGELASLEAELEERLDNLRASLDPSVLTLEPQSIAPRKADTDVSLSLVYVEG